jgi:hypothetical protein
MRVRTELESLGVNVSDVDSTLVGEEDLVTLSGRVDTDVVLGVGRVGEEGLDDEGVERSDSLLNLQNTMVEGESPVSLVHVGSERQVQSISSPKESERASTRNLGGVLTFTGFPAFSLIHSPATL